MAKVTVYDSEGKKQREVEIDPAAVDAAVRKPLLKESLIAWLASRRQGTHSTKSRAKVEARRSKPWRQKGTGHARAGSRTSPIWVGGGIAHGPKPRDYGYRLPTKRRRLAVRSAIRHHLEAGTICAVEGLDAMEKPRTKSVAGFLDAVGLGGKGVLLVSEANDTNLVRSARNIRKVDVTERRNLNAGQMLQRANLVFSAAALDALVKEVGA